MKTLAEKLYLKPGYRAALMKAPEGHEGLLAPLPEGVMLVSSPVGVQDFVLMFVREKADIDAHALKAIESVKPDGVLWFAYPKQTGSIKTDINRDKGWDIVKKAGWEGVSQISIDDTWSALRFKPSDLIKKRK